MQASAAPFLSQQLKIKTKKETAYTTMQDVELVLRFLTLESSWQDFSGDMRRSMDNFMEKNAKVATAKRDAMIEKFNTAIGRCESIWEEDSFKRPSTNSETRDQFLSGLYDAQMIAVSSITEARFKRVVANKLLARKETKALFKDVVFDDAVRRSTNAPIRVKYRIQKMIDTLESIGKCALAEETSSKATGLLASPFKTQ
jgi:hypothetical protein